MNKEDIETLKTKMNLSEKEVTKLKEGIINLYIDSVINKKPRLIKKYGEGIDEELKTNLDLFLNSNESLIKLFDLDKIKKIKEAGDIVLNWIPKKRIDQHKYSKENKGNFKYDNITRLLWFQENLLEHLK